MGRNTYEFGYQFGLKPGEPAYPHMEHLIFSNNLKFKSSHKLVTVVQPDIALVKDLKSEVGSDIYLCGGGQFAGWLLDHGMIDQLIVKLNPIVLIDGIPLFGPSKRQVSLELIESRAYSHGLQLLHYNINYE